MMGNVANVLLDSRRVFLGLRRKKVELMEENEEKRVKR